MCHLEEGSQPPREGLTGPGRGRGGGSSRGRGAAEQSGDELGPGQGARTGRNGLSLQLLLKAM